MNNRFLFDHHFSRRTKIWSLAFTDLKVRRVQKYVEALDVLKIKNSMPTSNGSQIPQQQLPSQQQMCSNGKIASPNQQEQARHFVGNLPIHTEARPQQSLRHSTSGAVVITTQWETFDSMPALLPVTPSTTTIASTTITSGQQKFSWDLLWVSSEASMCYSVWMSVLDWFGVYSPFFLCIYILLGPPFICHSVQK